MWYKKRKSAVNEQSVYVYSCTVLPLWWKSNMCPSLRILRHFYLNFSVFVSQKSNVLTNEVNGCAIEYWILHMVVNLSTFWVVNSTLVFSYEREREHEREVCLSAVAFFCKGDAICCSLQILSLAFWSRRRFYKATWIHLSLLRQKNLMNEPAPVRSTVSYCSEQQGIISHLPFQVFVVPWWCVHLCPIFFFTQHGDSFALKMELIYIRLLHFAVQK